MQEVAFKAPNGPLNHHVLVFSWYDPLLITLALLFTIQEKLALISIITANNIIDHNFLAFNSLIALVFT